MALLSAMQHKKNRFSKRFFLFRRPKQLELHLAVPITRGVVDGSQIVDKTSHFGWQITLLLIHRLDVVAGNLELIQHRHQLASLEFWLNFPGGAPANPPTLLDPIK